MTVRLYKSTDGSAPTLTGQVGTLVTVLDAILVNGYGSQTAAGWTKPYSGTNKAAYRNSTAAGNTGMYLNVDDSAAGTGGAKEAHMTGYQTMSALATGTGQFPTSSQLNIGASPAGSVVLRKSTTADSTARAWWCIADATCFYFFAETGDQTNPTGCCSFFFGDIFSYASSDPYKCMIIGRNNQNSGAFTQEAFDWFTNTTSGGLDDTIAGHFMASTQAGIGTSLAVGKHSDALKMGSVSTTPPSSGTSASGSSVSGFSDVSVSNFGYPNATDGGMYIAPVWVHHQRGVRGYMKGLWMPCQFQPLNHGDTVSGTGAMAGKTFQAIYILGANVGSSVNTGLVLIETSDTWS